MPYPDSEYPSVIRGKDKRESQRLLAAAPDLLRALKNLLPWGGDPTHRPPQGWGMYEEAIAAIAKAEGRSP